MREIIPLNYNWRYKPNFLEENITNQRDFELVNLPHTNIEIPYNNFDEKICQFISSYAKEMIVGMEYKGKRVILHFDGVMTYSEVYIDGEMITSHKGGYTPFKVDITERITFGETFLVFVKVDSTERSDIPPFGFVVDYLTYGGIYREVYLEIVEETYIENMFIKTENVLDKIKKIVVQLDIIHPTNQEEEITVTLKRNNEEVKEFYHKICLSQTIQIIEEVDDVFLWSIDEPNMYELQIKLLKDTKIESFGFREVEITKNGFYLNKEHVKLRGLNRHQSFPYVGYAMPKSAQKKDADILKYALGVNVVRSSHYPPSKHFLNRCDEIGLLVFNEIPGWQHIGDKAWQEVAITNAKEMVIRDYNHPSIFIWGVRINESLDSDEFYYKTNEVVKLLDDSRPTGGVRNFAKSNLLEDVYTYNDFLHRGYNDALSIPKNITKSDHPYLVTEYNGHMFPTKKFDDELHRIEHAYRHLRVQDYNYKHNQAAGAIGWCMFDYNTHKDFGSGDRICYHGVMDMFRIPKIASSVYASQQNTTSIMEVTSSFNIGEYPASEIPKVTVFTNCDYIKFYKNNNYIGTFYKDSKTYAYIPNPPIIIDDYIGDLIEKNEVFNKKDSKVVKEAFMAVMKFGLDKLPIKNKIKLLLILLKYKMSMNQIGVLYAKYMSNWGDESTNYIIEGYLDDTLVKKVTKCASAKPQLKAIIDDEFLLEDTTYDTTRVLVKCVDEYGNNLTYSSETISVNVNEKLEIIGPKQLSLIGGSIGFWVKTKGETGLGNISISSNYFEDIELQIEIKKSV